MPVSKNLLLRGLRAARPLAALVAIALVPTCNDPQSPSTVQDFRGLYRPGSGVMQFGVDTPGGGALRLEASDLQVDAETHVVRALVRIRNTGRESVTGPAGIEVLDFD